MNQNYQNHARLVTGFHRVLGLLLLLGFIGSIFNLYKSWDNDSLYSASLITLLFVCCIFLFWYTRSFPLKAQDRAIRCEENFRYYLLTGKALPNELSMGQVVALRFAPDEEFPSLVEKALSDKLNSKSIKLAVKNWKPDYYRV
jgi:signal transduction histidine kinase